MKIIITHKKPHLDEVAAIWLLNRYHPDCTKIRLRFISQNSPLALGKAKPKPSHLLIGTGQGAFDEHTGKKNDSAATLVFKFLDQSGWLPKELFKRRALETVVEHVRMTDFAENYQFPHIAREFLPEAIISGWKRRYSDAAVIKKGIDLMESIYTENKTWEETALLWPARKEFKTKRFRGVGLAGFPLSTADRLAHDHGFDFIIMVDTKYKRRQILADPRSQVDLSDVYNILLVEDKEADWFFHHSGKMLISGSEVAEDRNLSNLGLDELIEIAKRVL